MSRVESIQDRFNELDSKRQAMLTRCERYAELTLPKVFPKKNRDENSEELRHSFNSVGALAANNLANKLMLGLFAPSRPFFKYELTKEAKAELLQVPGIDESSIEKVLALAERDALKVFEEKVVRPVLFEACKHLFIVGNVLLVIHDDGVEVVTLRDYVAVRTPRGKLLELVIRTPVRWQELKADVRSAVTNVKEDDDLLMLYQHIRWDAAKDVYVKRYAVDENEITLAKYTGTYREDDMPYHALCWDLPTRSHYGVGLVEEFIGDFEAVDELSQANIQLAMLASSYRWLLSPASQMTAQDVGNSRNGDVLPGNEGELGIIMPTRGVDIGQVAATMEDHLRRINQAFLLTSNVVRDAERVTAEEVRTVAMELDTSKGGVYTRLARDMQAPLAKWVTKDVGISAEEMKHVKPVVITGLDALSRNGDLDNIRMFLSDLASAGNMPPEVMSVLKLDRVATVLAMNRGIDASNFIKSPEEIQAEQEAAMQQQLMMQAQSGAIDQQMNMEQ